MSKAEQQAMRDAMMMLGLAGEDVIRDSAEQVDASTLAADPLAYQGKWLVFESTVVWHQSRDGENTAKAQLKADESFVYWLAGPVAVMNQSDTDPIADIGTNLRIYGRVLAVSKSGMGLQASGKQELDKMDGSSAETMPLFLAKWVETP